MDRLFAALILLALLILPAHALLTPREDTQSVFFSMLFPQLFEEIDEATASEAVRL